MTIFDYISLDFREKVPNCNLSSYFSIVVFCQCCVLKLSWWNHLRPYNPATMTFSKNYDDYEKRIKNVLKIDNNLNFKYTVVHQN